MQQQDFTFLGLDLDSEPHRLQPGSYPYALNIRVNNTDGQNSRGVVEDIEGNALITAPLPSGVNTVIGTFANDARGFMLYFVYNDSGQHCILRYVYEEEAIVITLRHSLLNFKADKPIRGVGMVEDLVFWTDDHNEPRLLNYVRAEAGEYQDPLDNGDFAVINIIRRPPLYPLDVTRAFDTTTGQTGSKITTERFQFTYRYIYRDGQASVFAPVSKAIPYAYDGGKFAEVPISKEYVISTPTTDGYNTLEVVIPAIEVPNAEVESIEYYVRKGNNGRFGLIETRYLTEPDPRSVVFKNNKLEIGVSEAEEINQAHSVPVKVGTLEVKSGRLFLADYTEGYSNGKLAMSLTAEEDRSQWVDSFTIYNQIVWERQNNADSEAGSTTMIYFFRAVTGGYKRVLYDSVSDSFTDLTGVLTAWPPHRVSNTYGTETAQPILTTQVSSTTAKQRSVPAAGSRIHKPGAVIRGAIQFCDSSGRSNGATTSPDCSVQIPLQPLPFTPDRQTRVKWELTNPANIPIWATHFKVLKSVDQAASFFVQGVTRDAYHLKKYNTDGSPFFAREPTGGALEPLTYLDISSLADTDTGYSFSEGDRVRVYLPEHGWEDAEIKGQEGGLIYTSQLNLPFWLEERANYEGTISTKFVPLRMPFEIYTPYAPSNFEPYWEEGDVYPILNPGTASRDYSVTSGYLTGDAYFVIRPFRPWRTVPDGIADPKRTVPTPTQWRQFFSMDFYNPNDKSTLVASENYWDICCASMSPWDKHYTEAVTDKGRPISYDQNAMTRRLSSNGRFSNVFNPGSRQNGICEFEPLNYWEQPIEHGAITRLISSGNVMVSLQELAGRSIYIGQQQISDTEGQTLISVSNKVVGSQQDFASQSGTTVPLSVQTDGNNVYWLDAVNMQLMRKAGNGVQAISTSALIDSWIAERCEEIQSSGATVISGFDPKHKEYLLTIGTRTLSYNTKTGRCNSFYSYTPEAYGSCLNRLITFNQGEAWLHTPTAPRHTFFGQAFPALLDMVCNAGGTMEKLFLTIKQKASAVWAMPKITTPEGQQSNLIAEDFELADGWYHAGFLMDENTPVVNPLIEGDQLRSSLLRMRLQAGENCKLMQVSVGFMPN
jgi:hypothetical protein